MFMSPRALRHCGAEFGVLWIGAISCLRGALVIILLFEYELVLDAFHLGRLTRAAVVRAY